MTTSRRLRSRLQALQERVGPQAPVDCRRDVCDDIDALTAFYAGEGPRPGWLTDQTVAWLDRFNQAFDALAGICDGQLDQHTGEGPQ